jgi:predicted SnoaL-like aldol condensation-catalyzing enzyme
MRKIIFFAAAGLLCIFTSCNNGSTASGNDAETQKNLHADSIISHAFETGDVSGLDSVIANDCVTHGDKGDMGKDSIIAMAKMMKTMNKDMKLEKIRQLADKEYVFDWSRFTGTSDGSMGMPKGPYNMAVVEITKYKDGKAVEHWEFMEPREMMKMMPQMPQQQTNNMNGNKTDSSKMNK